jgi:alpha-glucosidase
LARPTQLVRTYLVFLFARRPNAPTMAAGRLSLLSLAAAAAAAPTRTPLGFTIPPAAPGGAAVTVEVASASSFRLGVRFGGWGAPALASPSLDPARAPAPWTPVSWPGGWVGVSTAFGALVAAGDGSGGWALVDAGNNTLVSAGGPPATNNASGTTVDAGIVLPVAGNGSDAGPARPCLGNGMFGPPFYYNAAGGYLSFAVSSGDYDPDYPHCYPAAFSGAIGGGGRDFCDPALRHDGFDAVNPVRSAAFPNGLSNTTYATCCAACNGAADCVAFVWSDGTRPDPTGNCWPLSSSGGLMPSTGRVYGGEGPPPPENAWWAMGSAADWYLAPVHTPLEFTRALYDLTGAPAVPPRRYLGFMATYWGYDTMQEMEGNGTAFRDGEYPIDLMIADYDWWLDPSTPDADFNYRPSWWFNVSFVHPPGSTVPNATCATPADVLAHWHTGLNMAWGGIRKPRTYSNIALANASGWLLPDSFAVGAGGNNFNFSAPGFAPWYVNNSLHFLNDGIDVWWNDEGETEWFTYTNWGRLEEEELAATRPGQRFFSINRAFQPGMQRAPAVTWTGDRQDCSHPTVLQFTAAGQLWTACDMTSPDATVLVRQYWNAVLLPIMRVHQMHGTPRFPFLWGSAEHQAAFRKALNTRYALIPFLYSLAHAAHTTGAPIVAPASYVLSPSADFPPAVAAATYMVSDVIVAADVSTSNGPDPNENSTHVNIPPGTWYAFNSTSAVAGPVLGLTYTDVPLDAFVAFVRAGAIIPLNRDVVQWAAQQGGDLVVGVYAGADGAFTLTEDDGETTAYAADYGAATRRTAFLWDDAARTLSWTVTGGFAGGPNTYTTAWAVLFVANATAPVAAAPAALGAAGSVRF